MNLSQPDNSKQPFRLPALANVRPLRPIRVLLAGRDRRYLRVMAFLLGRRGYDTQRMKVPPELIQRIVDIVRYTRSARGVEMGASTRAAVNLHAAARSQAVLRGSRLVSAEDIRRTAYLVLPHRILADDPYRVVREAVVAAFPGPTVGSTS